MGCPLQCWRTSQTVGAEGENLHEGQLLRPLGHSQAPIMEKATDPGIWGPTPAYNNTLGRPEFIGDSAFLYTKSWEL